MEMSMKSGNKVGNRRARASGIDLDKSEEKHVSEDFDKVQPIINNDPVIDFDQGNEHHAEGNLNDLKADDEYFQAEVD